MSDAKTKFTPGPWEAVWFGGLQIGGAAGYAIATMWDGKSKQSKIDANLIAAAPDLYEALVDLRTRFHRACLAAGSDAEFVEGSTPDADAALAKARGEA